MTSTFSRLETMFYTVVLLAALCIIEAVKRTNEITGDTANAVEGAGFKCIIQFYFISTDGDIDLLRLSTVFLGCPCDIRVNFLLLHCAVFDVDNLNVADIVCNCVDKRNSNK